MSLVTNSPVAACISALSHISSLSVMLSTMRYHPKYLLYSIISELLDDIAIYSALEGVSMATKVEPTTMLGIERELNEVQDEWAAATDHLYTVPDEEIMYGSSEYGVKLVWDGADTPIEYSYTVSVYALGVGLGVQDVITMDERHYKTFKGAKNRLVKIVKNGVSISNISMEVNEGGSQ